ncbi:putative alpha/beta superfamily hydrolase [Paenibacillus sp. LBL]|uniref:alpha/beta hydrolase n=1 Tax=Paenibacillus sp. LBL TaxID=2940563 RepID=UPI0024738637|nr:alpha/beta hydrolase-fold protein [Paenibacillus sp. LBL]MDH6669864.1 putative alpha/beta superfamily hydrolase [Paenibacillus sp. LBL]
MSNPILHLDMMRRSVELPNAEHWVKQSSAGHRRYRIMAAQPMGQAPPAGYPVIYLLDGNSVFHTMVETLRLQCHRPDKTGILPAVIVGIGYDTEGQYAPDRFYDYTPFPNTKFRNKFDGNSVPEQGGAAEFLQFMEEDLKPQIESEFNIDRNRRAIFGHSLGGLFTLYAMFSKPQAFRYYIAGSPSIHWNQEYLREMEQRFTERVKEDPLQVRLMLGAGELERSHVTGNCISACQLAERLAPLSGYGIHAEFKEFESEGHLSVLPVLISKALRFALNPDD